MKGTKAIITLILEPKLLAQLTNEARVTKRSRNNYINYLLERRTLMPAEKETK